MSFRKKKVIGIIPAKKNSTRLKDKNIKKINNLRLFEISVINALDSKILDDVIVSSNSNFILNKSKKLGAKILKRPDNLCKNNTDANKVIQHFINKLDSKTKSRNPYLVYLQPTSPLRKKIDIQKILNIRKKTKIENNQNIYIRKNGIDHNFNIVLSIFNIKKAILCSFL